MLLTCKVEAYGMQSVPDMRRNHRKTVPEWFPAERDRTDRQADRQTGRQTDRQTSVRVPLSLHASHLPAGCFILKKMMCQ